MVFIAKNHESTDEEKEEKGIESKDKPIYVKVDESTRRIIDTYKNLGTTISNLVKDAVEMYDDYNSMSPEVKAIIDTYKGEEENLVSFLEHAIQYYGQQKNLDRDLWVRTRDEMKMMLIGKTTFNQLIAAAEAPEDALEKPFKKNVAIDLILWYTGKPLKNLSLEEVITTVQKIWVVANYFYKIDLHHEGDEYHLLFKHRQNKRYSRYWLGYFTEMFSSEDLPYKCIIEGQTFDETLSMTIKAAYKKD
ncbi:MAG: hypothetical protein HWN80_03525 [Candidatus Lokiarchaeota archaeon]|nr:hypothetical protein [Candidatus Lokiarchaeota archaeon]